MGRPGAADRDRPGEYECGGEGGGVLERDAAVLCRVEGGGARAYRYCG